MKGTRAGVPPCSKSSIMRSKNSSMKKKNETDANTRNVFPVYRKNMRTVHTVCRLCARGPRTCRCCGGNVSVVIKRRSQARLKQRSGSLAPEWSRRARGSKRSW
eukprot:5953814-Prymnesium_polylepis.1